MKDYWSLVRPRILAMVLLAMTAAAWIVGGKPPGRAAMLAVAGAAGVIAGAVALNQRLERLSDAKMPRTADRPLPAGRLSSRQAAWFGVCTSLAGLAWLGVFSPPLVVAMAAGSWMVYVWVYTPLKSITIWQTPIGAAAGAAPILLGAAAVGRMASPTAWILFAVAFFWQFPHAMAVAWLYRRQFAEAAVKVAPVVDPSGRAAGWMAAAGAAAILPASLAPIWISAAGWGYGGCAAALGLAYLGCSLAFLARPAESAARRLFWASLAYLPLVLLAMLLL